MVCTGENVSISFNPKHLLSILKIENDIDFCFKLSGSSRATIINDKIFLCNIQK